MAGNDVSFMSNQSRKSQLPHQNIKKKQKIEPYISPFILNAKKIADERAKKALKILKEGKLTPHINEWDQNTRAPGLFDPSLKKQEIFRIEPRNRSRQARENETGQSNERSPTSVASRTTNSRITMKISASTPSRVPQGYRVNPNVVRANHPLRLSNERSRSPPQPKMSVPPPPANPPTMVSEGTDPLEGVSPRGRERRSHSPDNRKVTRSTSPIDEGIVKVLIAKEAREPPKKPTILEDILHERFRAGKGDINQQYGDIIRERLKTILNRRRRGAAAYPPRPPHSEEEQETEEEDFPHPPYYRQSRYYYPPGPPITQRKLDPNQVYTRDMMASMATIMTAVGDILVDRNKKDYWRKSKRRSKSSPPSSSSASNYNHQNPSSTEPVQLQYDKNNESFLFPDNNHANNSMKKSARVGSSEFMKEMSAMVFQQQGGLPKSKSVVVDMIMQKLQSIENCEREIADYLKQRKTATTTSAPPPTGDEDEEEPRSLPPPSPSSSQPTKFHPSQRSLPPLSAASMENHAPKTLSNVSSPSPALTIQQMQIRNNKQAEEQMNQRDLISFFPTLHSVGCDQADAINDYTKELQYVQRLQEAVYDKKQTSMAITVDTISDVLFDRVVYAVANEVEHVIDDYASKVIQKI